MDMQPLEQPSEASSAERRRQNLQIVSRGSTRQKKAKASITSGHEENDSPLLMMSSMSGEGDSHHVETKPSSPSKRGLLMNSKYLSKANGHGSGRAKKHSKRGSTTSMSTKITRALFRERRSSHGNFSKMVRTEINECINN